MIRFMFWCGFLLVVGIVGQGCTEAESNADETVEPEGSSYRLVAEFGGEDAFTYGVAVRDSIAVFGRGREIGVVDVSDPSHPAVVGTATLGGEIRDLVLRGAFAYAAAGSGGLEILDLSEPGAPELIGRVRFQDRAYGVDAEGDYVYVAARSEGLRIIDVSNPEEPVEVGHIVTPDEAVDVVVRDGFAYVAAWYESMRVIDVSEPTSPEEVSYASYDSYDNGAAWSVFVEEDLGLATVPDMGLRTVDISDPRDVKLYKVYRGLYSPAGVAARGRIAFVADQDAGFRVLDLTDPLSPVEIGSISLPGRAMAVSLSGDVAYVAAREGGLRIIDVSLPHDPREIGYVDEGDEVVDVVRIGEKLATAGLQNGVSFYGSSMDYEAVGHIHFPARRISTAGRTLLVAGQAEIAVFDHSDHTNLQARLRVPGSVRGVAVSDDVVIVATEQFGLRMLQLGQAGGLREVGSLEPDRSGIASTDQLQMLRTPVAAWDVVMYDELAVGAFDDGVRVIDVSTPTRPSLIGRLNTPERVYRLALRGSQLFAACDDGLRVIDMSDPAHPVGLTYLKTPSFATSLLLDEDQVHVGDLSGVMTTVSASHPYDRISEIKIADRVLGLAMLDEGIAVAAGRDGLRIVTDLRKE